MAGRRICVLVVRVTLDATSKIVFTSQASAMDMSRRSVALVSTWHHQVSARGYFFQLCSSLSFRDAQRHDMTGPVIAPIMVSAKTAGRKPPV